jgi:hypothetical protein
MAHFKPDSAGEALAHACLMAGELEAVKHSIDEIDDVPYYAKAALRRAELRIFHLAAWIERAHGINREDWRLNYFHDHALAARQLFPCAGTQS